MTICSITEDTDFIGSHIYGIKFDCLIYSNKLYNEVE